jgi:hypothetical protein
MKKFLQLLFTAFLFSPVIVLQAQQNTFSKMYTDSLEKGINGRAIVTTSDKGYLIVGEATGTRGLLIKTDSMGRLLWNKTIGKNNLTYTDIVLNSIVATIDSSFILSGNAYDSSAKHYNAICMKINSNGDLQWSKTIMQGNYNLDIYSLAQTNDSGYVMAGTANIINQPYQIFLAKLDFSGNLQWTNLFRSGNNNSYGYSVKQTPDSGYIVTGNITAGSQGVLLLKTTPTGIFSWAKKYNYFSQTKGSGNDLVITKDGILTYLKANRYALMKTDFSGNIIWGKLYQVVTSGPLNCNDCPPPGLTETSDTGYAFVNGSCFFECSITKTDRSGNISWEKGLYLIPIDVIESKKNKEMAVLGNGPLCGVSPVTLAPQVGVIVTDTLGNIQTCSYTINDSLTTDSVLSVSIIFTSIAGGIDSAIVPPVNSIIVQAYTKCVNISGGIKDNNSNDVITIYPNPSPGIFTASSVDGKSFQICIYNLLGENIYQSKSDDQQMKIDLTGKTAGIYFYKIVFSDKRIANGKLIITK